MTADRDPDSGSDGDSMHPPPCSDPDTIGDLVARDRRTSGPALRADGPGRTYSYRDFITTSYKAGNVLRHLGVRAGDEVLVVPNPLPEPVLTLYGAAQLGAVTRFGDTLGDDPPRVVLAPAAREGGFDLPPGHHLAVYGDEPDAPGVTHWETEVWSENPAVHPVDVAGSDPLLTDGGRTYSHADALSAAGTATAEFDLRPGTEVTVRGSFTDPDVVFSGLVAPILAGSTVVLPAGSTTESPSATIDVEGER